MIPPNPTQSMAIQSILGHFLGLVGSDLIRLELINPPTHSAGRKAIVAGMIIKPLIKKPQPNITPVRNKSDRRP